jgi:RNA polymerase sigma-70 factor (ECF subfamily)
VFASRYGKAAAQGHARARINPGFLHEKRLGVAKDPLAALNLYRQRQAPTARSRSTAATRRSPRSARRLRPGRLLATLFEPSLRIPRLRHDEANMELSNDEIFILLAQLGAGDEAAVRTLYQAFGRKIYAFALNRMRDPQQAEEVVVDTMYEVWRHPDRFRGASRFSTWLIGIARHKMLTALRGRDAPHEDIDGMADALASEDPGAFELLAERQRREGVQQCMEKLSEEHRECLHLVFYEGMSVAEVADVQRCPENTVKTRLFYARQKIRNCLRLLLERET